MTGSGACPTHHHHHEHSDREPAVIPARRRAFVFDMDGVMYQGGQLIDGAAEAVATVRNLGLPLFFVTNNSREAPVELAAKLQQMGVDAGPEEIISAVVATVEYLNRLDPKPDSVLVLGGVGLAANIEAAGFQLASFDDDEPVDVVVAGCDFGLTYDRLSRATRGLVVHDAAFIAVNRDSLLPTANGPMPGAGAIVGALTAATGIEPLVVGKPSPHLFSLAAERSGVPAEDLVILGDLLDADIAGANAIGATGVLVLTGSTPRKAAEAAEGELRPDLVIDNLNQLPYDLLLAP